MERLSLGLEVFQKALKTLEDILKEDFSIIVRDATIQRFEYTFESFWKMIRFFLKEIEGINCNSPKSCFKELLSINLINKDITELLLEMTDMRNLTSHTYIEEIAQDLYNKITESYCSTMKGVYDKILQRISPDLD